MLEALVEFEEVSSSATQELHQWLEAIFNHPIVTICGCTITIGLILSIFIKIIITRFGVGKVANQQAQIIEKQNAEIALLKQDKANMEAQLKTLNAKMDVVTKYSPNKRVRDAHLIHYEPIDVEVVEIPTYKKKVKIKVRKHTPQAKISAQAVDVLKDVINNGK